jgi:hypothetical protein
MRAGGFAMIVLMLAMLAPAPARAKCLGARDLLRRAETAFAALFGRGAANHDVIRPPVGIDPGMVVRPPPRRGTMRIIPPPERGR